MRRDGIVVIAFEMSGRVFLWIFACFTVCFQLFVFGHFRVMDACLEQRTNIKFLAQSGKSPTQILQSLQQVYGRQCLSYPQVRMWCRRFSSGRTDVKDDPRTGRPTTRLLHVTAVHQSLQQDSRKTVKELSTELGVPSSTVFKVIKKDLNMRKLSPKFIPHLINDRQKADQVVYSTANLELVRTVPRFLDRIVSGDETWVSIFHQETKFESCQWTPRGGARPTKAVKSNSVHKTMLILFHDAYGVIHLEFLPRGETIDADFYCDVLRRLKEQIRRKRPGLWERDDEGYRGFYLHHDNATPHTAIPTLALIGESGMNMVSHPAYSPDLAPCDFAIFPYLKKQLHGIRFQNIQEVQDRVRLICRNTEPEIFYNAIRNMAIRWKKCVAANGDYFEGQNVAADPVSEAEYSSDEF